MGGIIPLASSPGAVYKSWLSMRLQTSQQVASTVLSAAGAAGVLKKLLKQCTQIGSVFESITEGGLGVKACSLA